MGEHEHNFEHVVIDRFPGGGMPSLEFIRGYRCECGAVSLERGTAADRAKLFDPLENAKAALRRYAALHRAPWTGSRYAAEMWRSYQPWSAADLWRDYLATADRWRGYVAETNEEDQMQDQTTLRAPDNPYRQDGREVMLDVRGYGIAGEEDEGRALDLTGPGLTAADLDHIARKHWRAGKARAERLAREREEVMLGEHRDELAAAFDEGYTTGRAEPALGLAREFRSRLTGVHFALMQIEAGNSQERAKQVPGLRAQIDELLKFAETVATSEQAAAAQVARDEAAGS